VFHSAQKSNTDCSSTRRTAPNGTDGVAGIREQVSTLRAFFRNRRIDCQPGSRARERQFPARRRCRAVPHPLARRGNTATHQTALVAVLMPWPTAPAPGTPLPIRAETPRNRMSRCVTLVMSATFVEPRSRRSAGSRPPSEAGSRDRLVVVVPGRYVIVGLYQSGLNAGARSMNSLVADTFLVVV